MKKKGSRNVPDFARHSTPAKTASRPATDEAKQSRTATPRPTVKPQATSSKAGRRGQ